MEIRWLEGFAGASPDAALIFDADGAIVFINQSAAALFGCDPSQVMSRPVERLLPGIAPAEIVRGSVVELEAQRSDGTVFHAEVSFTSIGSDVPRRVAFVRDVSARYRLEHERLELAERERSARATVEQLSLIKDEFLATLSHELRTPLNAMLGWTQVLKKFDFDPQVHARAVEAIERNIRIQTEIIEDLLDMSQIVSGRLRLEPRPTSLAAVIEAACEIIAPAAQNKDIRLERELDPDVAPVQGDPNRLQQVVWNLLSNAVKFTPRGGTVTVRLRQLGSMARIDVIDTGIGIDSAFAPHLFDRFRQADTSTTRSHGGLGLGLAIVKGLIEMHGGMVRAESDGANTGATFVVLIPT